MDMKKVKSAMGFRYIWLLTVIFCAVVMLQGCESSQKLSFKTEYQAVFLQNGQAFFGKISESDAKFLLLTDVFYVQSVRNPETQEVSNILIKRGSEWHGPDLMRINTEHIVLIEPVGAASKVAQLITEANKKK